MISIRDGFGSDASGRLESPAVLPRSGDFLPQPGRAEEQRLLGLPKKLRSDWPVRLGQAFEQRLDQDRAFRIFLEACVRCGACAAACPVYLATGDPGDMPVARAELLRQVRRLFLNRSRQSGTAPAGSSAEHLLVQCYVYFYQCAVCRRCARFCPLGIDNSELVLAGRQLLASIGLTAHRISRPAALLVDSGNSLGRPADTWTNACAALERFIYKQTGIAVRLPVDQADCDVLLIPASADLFVHTESMIGYAKMFHTAGMSWTTSTLAPTAEIWGRSSGHRPIRELGSALFEAARELRPKSIVWGESGHGWRTACHFLAPFSSTTEERDFWRKKQPIHICQLADWLLARGFFNHKLDQTVSRGLKFTYHDPCHCARSASIIEEPRRVLKAVVEDFREMPPGTIKEMTLCCGAGGLGDDEARALHQAVGAPRARAFLQSGADFLVTTCATCKSALKYVLGHHIDGKFRVGGVIELLGLALTSHLVSLGRPDNRNRKPGV